MFEKFQEGFLVHVSKWSERNIYESLFGLKHPIKFLLTRTYGLEEDVV